MDNARQNLNPEELYQEITNLRQIIATQTAELKQEIRQRQQLIDLLSATAADYRASETRLQDIINSAIATWLFSFRVFPNYDWEYEYQSPACETIFGYTSQEILADKYLWMSRVHPEDKKTVIIPLFADFLAERTTNVEVRFYHKDGSLRWISTTYTSRYHSEDNCWIVTGISIDITKHKQTEAALRHSEERWQLAIAGTDEAIWDWDITTNITFRSDRWFEMLGYRRHELSNWDDEWSKRIHPDDYERVITAQAAYLQRQTHSYSIEYRLRRKDSSYGWFRSRAKAVWDEQGNPIRLVGSLGDITERKRVEMELLQSETQYRLLFEANPNPMWIFDLETLRFLAVNQAAIHKYGYSESEFLSMTLADIRPPEEISYLHTTLSTFQSCSPSMFVCEAKHWKRDGTIINVEINSHSLTWAGKPAKFVLAKDITAQKTALRDRQQMATLLNNLINGSTDLIAALDLDFKFIAFNKAYAAEFLKIFGRHIQLGMSIVEALAHLPQEQAKNVETWARALAGEQFTVIREFGNPNERHFYEINYSIIQDANGKQIGASHIVRDISDRQRAQEKLRYSQARLATTQKIAHVGSWEWDFHTQQRHWSTETFHIFGLNPQQPEPSHAEFLQLVHPEDCATVQNQFIQTIAHNTPFYLEYRIIRPDGAVRYVESRGEVIYEPKNPAPKLFGAIIDITERKQAELEIIHSRDLREAIFNESADALFLVDPETLLITDCNQQAVKLFEAASKAQLIGTAGHTLQKQPLSPEELAACMTATDQHEFWSQEIEYISKQGNCFWGNLATKRISAAGKEMYLVRVTDISERKQAEQALQEKEAFLRSIYDNVEQAIFVVNVQDNDFRYAGLNWTHETLTGLCSSDLQGKTPEQILPPATAQLVRQHYQDCIDAGESITYEECLPFQGELTWWITSLTPLRDQHSRVYRIVGNSINISDRKRSEQMLELQAVITRNMAEGICLVRADDCVIVYTNPKFDQMFGYEAGELIDQHASIINYEDGRMTAREVHEAIASAVIQYGETTYEVHNVKKDGTPFWCSATTSVFAHPEYGKVFVTVQQDITEHKQAEEKIKASLREKEVLLKEIHHRVKNNLGIVSSLLQMQSRRTQESQATAILRDSQNRIASIALVHEKLYRSDDLANIDFAQYIPDLTTHLFDSYNVSSNDIQLNIQVEDISLDIETAIPCGLIINELVSNALKYAFPIHRLGEIQVRLWLEDNHTLILIVRDNGVGLPAEFDSKKSKTLGMTLIQGLVKQLRGNLEINSQQGTEFKITFTTSKV
ncbi:PAS domain S-box protein [Anabaena sp. 4-3]|uniref:PAS domain S-box protein n=1 Tax=Anabaena sp. 4-3 TaxID=1811979 RepID=UPI0008359D9C|nr:PAS domain S-box protein [Anabaena sp. 4-3]